MQDKNKTERADHIKEFTGKYEATNPISRYLVDGFYKGIYSLLPTDISSVLEAGCGAGFSTERITKMLPDSRYEASDLSDDLITLAQPRVPSVPFTTESIYELKREDDSFDLTIALETLEHLDDPLKALMELKRVSRKYVLISVPNEPLWHVLNLARLKYVTSLGNTPGHINHWSKRSLVKFATQAGKVIDSRSPTPWNMLLLDVS